MNVQRVLILKRSGSIDRTRDLIAERLERVAR
jgi:hypothetical protein